MPVKILYCDNCGSQITPDVSKGKADDGRNYCDKCTPLYNHTTTALQKVQLPSEILDEKTREFAAAKEPAASAQTVMKFYFCETCGKRITDKQILDGLGRDKKLKGVYCKDCAVGVMTIEFAAIKEIPAHVPPHEQSTPPMPNTGTKGSSFNLASAHRTNKLSERVQAHGHKSASSSGENHIPTVAIIGGVSTVLVILVLVFGSSSSSNSSSQPTVARKTVDPIPSPTPPSPVRTIEPVKPKNSSIQQDVSRSSRTIPSAEGSQNINSEADVKAEYDSLVKKVGSTDGDTPGRIAAVDAFLKVHGDSTFAGSARLLKNGIAATETSKKSLPALPAEPVNDTERVAKPVIPTVESQIETKIETSEDQKQIVGILKELTLLVRHNHFIEAEKFLDEKLHDVALDGIAKRLKKERADIVEIRALRERALDALRAKNGTTVSLMLQGTKMTGTIKADPTGVSIALHDGPEMAIRANQLDAKDVAAFAPAETGEGRVEDLRRRALLFLAAGEFSLAEDYFAKAHDSGLSSAELTPYLDRIAATKTDARDAAASAEWKRVEGLFAGKNWKSAKQGYETFQRDYAGSAVLANNAETLKKRLESLDEALERARDLSLDLGGDVKLELVLIPAGEFEMGSNNGDNDAKPAHKVKISRPFYMGKYVVTQSQYEKVMGNNPSANKGDNQPVEMMSYLEAETFCKKASKLTGTSMRLPTEAEWEYACRANSNTGDTKASLEKAGWFAVNSGSKVHPVGQKKPNAWGLYDMHGNVWQRCKDWYADDYYGKSETDDPQGPAKGVDRVVRGGSLDSDPFMSTQRNKYPVDSSSHWNMGFRVVAIPGTKTTSP